MAGHGGPAFPTDAPMVFVRTDTEEGERALREAVAESRKDFEYTGMTLRDYFAGQALVGLMASQMYTHAVAKAGVDGETAVALAAYRMADAMLAARGED